MERLSGRLRERTRLEEALRAPRSEFIAIYGRRRVGKTFLVRRFFQDESVGYFEVTGRFEGSRRQQLEIFADALSATFHGGRPQPVPDTWREAFQRLRARIQAARRPRGGRWVLFFDELPWLATRRSGCLSALEHFWNTWCSGRDDIVLIVCGSAASWMLRRFVNARGGLHNRLTGTMRLLPFDLGEVRTFFRDRDHRLTEREIAELVMTLGGVPHYLGMVRRGRSVAQIVDELVVQRDAPLAQEFDHLFASLFGADRKYRVVVEALATRRGGLSRNELLEKARLPSGGGASAVLDNLEQAGFIASSIPFGRRTRDRSFRLTDELSLFHLKWLRQRRPQSWQPVRGTPRWQTWAGLAFESLCLRHAPAIQAALGLAGVHVEASMWSHPKAQIDLVLDRADGVISLVEIKFSDGPYTITSRYAAQLRNKIDTFRTATGTRKGLQLVFVTTFGLVDNVHSRALVDGTVRLTDLFGSP